MAKDLPGAFYDYGKEILAGPPEFEHSWSIEPGYCLLTVPAASPESFEIEVAVEKKMATVAWGNWHTHFWPDGDADEFVVDLFGLLRDMLSSDMRVRELQAAGYPYRGFLESFDGQRWSTEEEMGLVFWNYFGKRSEKIYSNALLSPRMQGQGAQPDGERPGDARR